MPSEFRISRRVEFHETDMAGIVHFSNYFRYIEAAEHAFFRSMGLEIHTTGDDGMYGWARVHASCDFLAPLRYQDEVEVHLRVVEKKPKAISYEADLQRVAGGEQTLVARARWSVVCVRKNAGDTTLRSAPMPDDVNAQIETAPNAANGKDE